MKRQLLDPFLAWFKEHGFLRAVEFTKVAAIHIPNPKPKDSATDFTDSHGEPF